MTELPVTPTQNEKELLEMIESLQEEVKSIRSEMAYKESYYDD